MMDSEQKEYLHKRLVHYNTVWTETDKAKKEAAKDFNYDINQAKSKAGAIAEAIKFKDENILLEKLGGHWEELIKE